MLYVGVGPLIGSAAGADDGRVQQWLSKCWLKTFASRSVVQDGEQEEDKALFKINKLKSLGKQTSICSAREGGMEGKSPCVSLIFF